MPKAHKDNETRALRVFSENNVREHKVYRKELGATNCFKKQTYLQKERDEDPLFQFYAQKYDMIGKCKQILLKVMKFLQVIVTRKGRKNEGTEEIRYEWE